MEVKRRGHSKQREQHIQKLRNATTTKPQSNGIRIPPLGYSPFQALSQMSKAPWNTPFLYNTHLSSKTCRKVNFGIKLGVGWGPKVPRGRSQESGATAKSTTNQTVNNNKNHVNCYDKKCILSTFTLCTIMYLPYLILTVASEIGIVILIL